MGRGTYQHKNGNGSKRGGNGIHIQLHKIIGNNKEDEEVGELILHVNSTQASS